MNVLGDDCDMDSLRAFLNESHSSAFSGISSDQVAKNTWHANCEAHCCQPIPHGEYTAAIECNHHAADELICLPFGPSCVFSDVLDFATPQVKSCALASVECGQASFDSLASLFFAKGAVGQHAPCRRHGKHCCFKRCKGNVSGSPCTDFRPSTASVARPLCFSFAGLPLCGLLRRTGSWLKMWKHFRFVCSRSLSVICTRSTPTSFPTSTLAKQAVECVATVS